MFMDEQKRHDGRVEATDEAIRAKIAEIPFPKMVVIHQGWLRDRITRHTADELMDQHRDGQGDRWFVKSKRR